MVFKGSVLMYHGFSGKIFKDIPHPSILEIPVKVYLKSQGNFQASLQYPHPKKHVFRPLNRIEVKNPTSQYKNRTYQEIILEFRQ
jgi:hypothetical protein